MTDHNPAYCNRCGETDVIESEYMDVPGRECLSCGLFVIVPRESWSDTEAVIRASGVSRERAAELGFLDAEEP